MVNGKRPKWWSVNQKSVFQERKPEAPIPQYRNTPIPLPSLSAQSLQEGDSDATHGNRGEGYEAYDAEENMAV